ncbi:MULTISPECIES: carbohydrate ABC transporter permease [unclassified Frondihabitans]|uniref:carbohydrate ABC transporter permease n=1 Tax=unclassified Frondihabitans TaxID=2626248 RepID=UPI000F4E0AF3|nr:MULTISPECIES: carbohydrate ABC transporter permease [unclassified Frondihabitans]RPE78065.1 alpha-glucoside transport system permease protein [Frondihabitans sp. PhB153]RPF08345.1 alpha-glucoside transport system permease protein [Frondihabitans sp. PhB161]
MTEIVPTVVTQKTKTGTRAARMTKTSAPKKRPTLTIILGLVAVLWMVPAIGLLVTSFRSTTDAQTTGWWSALLKPFTSAWTFDNYVNAFNGAGAGTGQSLGGEFLNSLAVAIPATVLPIMFAAFAAYAFTFLEFRGKELYFAVIVGLLVVPVQIALIPVLQTYKAITQATGIQITGTYPAAWIVHSAFALPLCIFILRNYMSTLPNALIEAARVDGASHFQIFWRLVMPMSIPALASFAIFQFLWVWNDFLVAYIFLGNGSPVLQQGLLGLLGQYNQGWNLVAAGAFIVLLVPLVVFLSLQRFFVRGLTAGSVK